MTYQTQSQFAPNRLTEEAAAAADPAAAAATFGQNTANSVALPIQAPARSSAVGPAVVRTTVASAAPTEEVIDQKLVHRLAKAADTALAGDGDPVHLKELEELISI